MKKISTLILLFIAAVSSAFAQVDTLLFENFQYDSLPLDNSANNYYYSIVAAGDFPTAENTNPEWINWDFDGIPDASGGTTARPDQWFLTLAYSLADSLYMPGTFTDSLNVVMGSNSWSNGSDPTQNYLILPKIYVADNQAILRWKSAPFQTPRYLDGYQVLVSTTGNQDYNFTDTIARLAEFTGASDLEDSTTYTFSPGIRHSLIEDNGGDILRYRGVLQEFEVSLAAYAGQSIFISFLHGCTDDNLISIDDVLVLGTGNVGVEENKTKELTLMLNPNPSKDFMQVNYTLNKTTAVTTTVYDIDGKLIETKQRGMQIAGNQQFTYGVSHLAAGSYFFTLDTGKDKITQKFIVVK